MPPLVLPFGFIVLVLHATDELYLLHSCCIHFGRIEQGPTNVVECCHKLGVIILLGKLCLRAELHAQLMDGFWVGAGIVLKSMQMRRRLSLQSARN